MYIPFFHLKFAAKIKLTFVFVKKFHNPIVVFFTLLMFYIISNKAVFTHTHRLADGTYVIHAHPYDKSEDHLPENQHHHHSGYEYLSIGALDSYISLNQIEFKTPIYLPVFTEIFFYVKEFFSSGYFYLLNNKSPPTIEFI